MAIDGAKHDFSRYHRQMLLEGFGADGQLRLSSSHAAVVGVGALGCAIADFLARAGVGTLTIIDRDVVEPTNLQRQTLFDEADARDGVPKAEAAARRLRAINSGVRVFAEVADLASDNAEALLGIQSQRPGVVVDGTDNFAVRYLLNDVCVKHAVPYGYGGVVGTSGVAATILPGVTPCLRCLAPDPPAPGSMATCDTAGVLGPAVAMIAAMQASDALKVLLDRTDLVSRRLAQVDLWRNEHREIDLSGAADAGCICCAQRRFEFLAGRGAEEQRVLCGRNSVQLSGPGQQPVPLEPLAERLSHHGRVSVTPSMVRCSLAGSEGWGASELTVFADGRVVVYGTTDAAVARSVRARLVGW